MPQCNKTIYDKPQLTTYPMVKYQKHFFLSKEQDKEAPSHQFF